MAQEGRWSILKINERASEIWMNKMIFKTAIAYKYDPKVISLSIKSILNILDRLFKKWIKMEIS